MTTLRNIGLGLLVSAAIVTYGCKDEKVSVPITLPSGAVVHGVYADQKDPSKGFYAAKGLFPGKPDSVEAIAELSRLEMRIVSMDVPSFYKALLPEVSAKGAAEAMDRKAGMNLGNLTQYVVIVADPVADRQVDRTIFVNGTGSLPAFAAYDLWSVGSMLRPPTVDAKDDEKGNTVYTIKGMFKKEAFVLSPEELLRSNGELQKLPTEPKKVRTPQLVAPPAPLPRPGWQYVQE